MNIVPQFPLSAQGGMCMKKNTFLISLAAATILIAGTILAESILHAAPEIKANNEKAEGILMDGTKDATYVKKDGIGVIYLAGGCFWGMEKLMEALPGVIGATSGYANGKPEIVPTYELVCTGKTGYKETVRVEYKESEISLETILFTFFDAIDTTATDRQGNDRGTQYQSGVYYTDKNSQRSVDRVVKVEKNRNYGFAVQTEPLTVFHEAEEYHQNYLEKHPNGYCHISRAEMKRAEETEVDAAPYSPMSEEEMARKLTPLQIKVTQKSATEPPFDNEFWDSDKEGLYVDITTGEPLFSSKDKFKSSCGWPAFAKPVDQNVVRYIEDDSFGMARTEVRSRAGNAHLGHVFDGDPASPNGIRFCINSAALRFIPYDKMKESGYEKYIRFVR